MKIVIDTTALKSAHKTRGVGQYARYLIKALRSLKSNHRFVMTSKVDSVSGVDLIHYPYFDLFHSRLPLFQRAKAEVVTIHDLIPLRFPEEFKPGIRSGLNLRYQQLVVRRMGAVITDSAHSKSDVISLLKIPPERVFVVNLGVSRQFKPATTEQVKMVRKKLGLPKKFILYVGDVNVNKNLETLMKTIKELKEHSLVMVSQAMKNKAVSEVRQLYSLIETLGIGDRVLILSQVPVDQIEVLRAIYSAAEVYVQPSTYEGFGLPVLEAMACGVPVVSSNSASLPEVAGEAAFLVEPSTEQLVKAISKLRRNRKLRANLREKGLARAKRSSWEKTARETIRVYEGVNS